MNIQWDCPLTKRELIDNEITNYLIHDSMDFKNINHVDLINRLNEMIIKKNNKKLIKLRNIKCREIRVKYMQKIVDELVI